MITPLELHHKVFELLGDFTIIKNHREGSKRTGVWEIQAKCSMKKFYVKSFSRVNRWHPEVYAYKNWITSIKPFAPELVGVINDNGIYAIVISSLGGVTLMDARGLTDVQKEEAFYKAGELTKLIHNGFEGKFFGRPDIDGNPIEIYHSQDPVEYYEMAIKEALNHGKLKGYYNTKELLLGEWALNNSCIFKNEMPRPTSWDSSPNNWIVDESNGDFLGMIDFENMLWGFAVDSFTILFDRYFPEFPKGEKAFFVGYGYDILTEKEGQIRLACIKSGLCNINFGYSFKDDRMVAIGRKMLGMIVV